jgi:DNA-binding NarL/FixJ family response regulator
MNSWSCRVKDESKNQGYPHPCADDLDVQILGLMCEGMPDIAISRQLGLGMRTVQRRIGRMMKETESPSRFTFGATLYRMGVMGEPRFNSRRTARSIRRRDAD